MTLVEENLDQENVSVIVLDKVFNSSYNLDTGKEKIIDERRTCNNNLCGEFKNSYCMDRGISVSPRYHCNKTLAISIPDP